MMQQDSTHPTGVRSDKKHPAVSEARRRKASAAVQLRLSGANWEEIAQAVGYPTPRQALVATEKILEDLLHTEGDRTVMRQMAGMRLERLLRSVWAKAIDPDSDEHLPAVTKAREIIAQHARLFGLDAPTEYVVHSPTQAEIERWVSQVVSHSQPEVTEYDILELGEDEYQVEPEEYDDAVPPR